MSSDGITSVGSDAGETAEKCISGAPPPIGNNNNSQTTVSKKKDGVDNATDEQNHPTTHIGHGCIVVDKLQSKSTKSENTTRGSDDKKGLREAVVVDAAAVAHSTDIPLESSLASSEVSTGIICRNKM